MAKARPAELLDDEGILSSRPVLEFFAWGQVRKRGGLAVLPLRAEWLEASSAGVEAVSLPEKIGPEHFSQAVVHLQKGKASTAEGVAAAWGSLEEGGRLYLVGSNELGIKTAIRKLSAGIEMDAEIPVTRAHSRVAVFRKSREAAPQYPDEEKFELSLSGRTLSLKTRPGVFSAGRLDRGSAMLLDEFQRMDGISPRRVLDLGCGAGVLAMAAALRFQEAEVVAADHDRRAISSAEQNADASGVGDRLRLLWWDALTEELPLVDVDLALVNPPFHRGKDVALDVPRAFFRRMGPVMKRESTALVVANNTLPYEGMAGQGGRLKVLREEGGFKLLRIDY